MTAISVSQPANTRRVFQLLGAIATVLVIAAFAAWLALRPSSGSSSSPRVVGPPHAQVNDCQPTLVIHAC